MEKSESTKFISEIPSEYGKCVGIIAFKDEIYVACENAIFWMFDKKLYPCRFEQVEAKKL